MKDLTTKIKHFIENKTLNENYNSLKSYCSQKHISFYALNLILEKYFLKSKMKNITRNSFIRINEDNSLTQHNDKLQDEKQILEKTGINTVDKFNLKKWLISLSIIFILAVGVGAFFFMKETKTEETTTSSPSNRVENKEIILPDGTLCTYSGEMKDNLPHGIGKLTFDDLRYYDGSFDNGKIQGYGKIYDEKGFIYYDGQWKDGKKDGYGTTFDAKGDTLRDGYWEKDKPTSKAKNTQK